MVAIRRVRAVSIVMCSGAMLIVEGQWRVDKRYGRQFAAESWSEPLPATIVGIEKYLGSGLVKGIGPKFAKLIVARFGLDTFDVIENDADKLLEVYGIGKGRVVQRRPAITLHVKLVEVSPK